MTTCLALSVISVSLFLGSVVLVVFAKDGAPGLALAARIGLAASVVLIGVTLYKVLQRR
jgi:uncharacterized membrane protein